jgi:hypothetical protein
MAMFRSFYLDILKGALIDMITLMNGLLKTTNQLLDLYDKINSWLDKINQHRYIPGMGEPKPPDTNPHRMRRAMEGDGNTSSIYRLPVYPIAPGYRMPLEQYAWEGHAANFGPRGNRLGVGYGVGLGIEQQRKWNAKFGDLITLQFQNGEIIRRRLNETSERPGGIEFFSARRGEYESKGRVKILSIEHQAAQARARERKRQAEDERRTTQTQTTTPAPPVNVSITNHFNGQVDKEMLAAAQRKHIEQFEKSLAEAQYRRQRSRFDSSA